MTGHRLRGFSIRVWALRLSGLCLGLLLAGSAQAQPFAYVTNLGDSTVSVLNTATNTVGVTVMVGGGPQGVASARMAAACM